MTRICLAFAAALAALGLPATGAERVVCTLALEVGSSEPLLRDGDCDARIAPASTFKVAISLMGFDSGILTAPDAPEWPFQEGYADWNPAWRQPTTPASWMRDSVVWYSQRVTETLGAERFAGYVAAFGYGNADVSGDPGAGNGLTRAWLSSSLQISPAEQVAFLTRMLAGDLPVSAVAVEQTAVLMEDGAHPRGWRLHGKTGAGFPRGADGALLRDQPFGWYVGWAEREGRRVAFARLSRFDEPPAEAPGRVARGGLIEALFAPDGALN